MDPTVNTPNQNTPAPTAAPAGNSPAPTSAPAAPQVSPEVSVPAATSIPAEGSSVAGTDTTGNEEGLARAPEGEKPAPAPETKPAESKEAPKPDGAPEGSQPDAKKEEGGQSAEPAPLPSYDPFVLADGMQLDTEKVGEFTKVLGEFEQMSKADHAEVQKLGQQLIERHVALQTDLVTRLHAAYQESWKKQGNDWYQQFRSDPEIGGNREQTSLNAGINLIAAHGGTPKQVAELRSMLGTTGVAKHPALIRLFVNLEKSPLHREGKPLPANNQPVKQASKTAKFYGGTT